MSTVANRIVAETDARRRRIAEIRASGRKPAPLEAPWQQELRGALVRYARRYQIPREDAYAYLLAELLRWAREEDGWNPRYLAEVAAGYAETFPKYGGVA